VATAEGVGEGVGEPRVGEPFPGYRRGARGRREGEEGLDVAREPIAGTATRTAAAPGQPVPYTAQPRSGKPAAVARCAEAWLSTACR
jgi:hypothetical protein